MKVVVLLAVLAISTVGIGVEQFCARRAARRERSRPNETDGGGN